MIRKQPIYLRRIGQDALKSPEINKSTIDWNNFIERKGAEQLLVQLGVDLH